MKKSFKATVILVFAMIVAAAFVLASCADYVNQSYDKGEERPAGSELSGYQAPGGSREDTKGSENKEDHSSKLIKEIEIHGETKKFDEAKDNIYALIEKCGGYVESSDSEAARYDSYSRGRSLSMIIRIPTEKLDEFSSSVGESINIYSSKEKLSDATASYYDMKARMDTLITKRDALTRMLEEAKDIPEMLTIQDRLYDTIADIEAYETALRNIDGKVAYSTISLTLSEVKEYTPVQEESFAKRFSDSFMNGWKRFGEAMQEFAIWFVGALPVLLFLGVIGLVIFLIIFCSVRAGRRRRAKAAKTVMQRNASASAVRQPAAPASTAAPASSASQEQPRSQNNIYGNNP